MLQKRDEVQIMIDGELIPAVAGELVVEAVLRTTEIPHICYHSPLMGPIQSCDTCMVELNGTIVRACGVTVMQGQVIVTTSDAAQKARTEAFDTILGNHMLYCTVCDNNNENCRVHNTALELEVKHQVHPFKRSRTTSTCRILSTGMTPASASFADNVCRPARQCRSMRH